MSGCVVSNCSTSFCISVASLPCTGTGKKKSMSVAALRRCGVTGQRERKAGGGGVQQTHAVDSLYFIPDNVKLATKRRWNSDEHHQQRCGDEERAGGDDAPLGAGLRARGERRQPDRQHLGGWRRGGHQRPEELVPVRGDGDDGEGGQAGPRQRQQHAEDDGQAPRRRRASRLPRNRAGWCGRSGASGRRRTPRRNRAPRRRRSVS